MSMVPHGAAGQVEFATRYPVYQIDFSAVASGKRIATTKRRVRWRFGFPNREALADGQTGTACRGEEHDVTVVWSVTSGKRQITMDGKEVHFSASRGSVMDFSWSVRGNHVIKVVCHASPPLSAIPGFRQYDMFIDGQSFFTMPKVYELGIKGPGGASRAGGAVAAHYASPPSDSYRNYDLNAGVYGASSSRGVEVPRTADEEEAALKRAIAESLEESRRHVAGRSKVENGSAPDVLGGEEATTTADLLDFGGAVAPAPFALMPATSSPPVQQDSQSLVTYGAVPSQYQGAPPMREDDMSYSSASYVGAPPVDQYAQPPSAQYGAPTHQQYAPQPPAQDQFAPQPPAYAPMDQFAFAPQSDDPFAPKPPPPPTRDAVTSAILGAYGTPAPAPPPQQNGGPYQPGYETPMAGQPVIENGVPQPGQAPLLSMSSEYEEPEEPQSELEKAMKNLVNFDRIDEPAEKVVKLTMKKEEEKKKKNSTSALPPAGSGWLGSSATLSQIQQVKPEKPRKDPTEIMSPPQMLFSPGAVNAGALVVHGQGPPPLQQGFGVGAQMGYGMPYGMPPQQQGYYAQQQQGYYAQQPPPPQQQQGYYAQQPPPPPQQQYNNY